MDRGALPKYRDKWSGRPGPSDCLTDAELYDGFPFRPYPKGRETTRDIFEEIHQWWAAVDDGQDVRQRYGKLACVPNSHIYSSPHSHGVVHSSGLSSCRDKAANHQFAMELRWKVKIIKMKREALLDLIVRPCGLSEAPVPLTALIEISEAHGDRFVVECQECRETLPVIRVGAERYFPFHCFVGGTGTQCLLPDDMLFLDYLRGDFSVEGKKRTAEFCAGEWEGVYSNEMIFAFLRSCCSLYHQVGTSRVRGARR